MQLNFRIIVVTIIIFFSFCLQAQNCNKAKKGFILYDLSLLIDSMPQEVIFIPYQIDESKKLSDNLSECLKDSLNSKGYFLFFSVMRHTQPYILDFLKSIEKPIDTSFFKVHFRLRHVINEMETLDAKAINFPVSFGIMEKSNLKLSAGVMLYEEFRNSDLNVKNSDLKEFYLDFDSVNYKIIYSNNATQFGLKLCFLPYIFNN